MDLQQISQFGTSEDLKIYHQGNSDIKNTTGYLRLLTDNFSVLNGLVLKYY